MAQEADSRATPGGAAFHAVAEKTLMLVVCAWCGKDLGTKEPLSDTSVTHGICPECLEKELLHGGPAGKVNEAPQLMAHAAAGPPPTKVQDRMTKVKGFVFTRPHG